MTRIIIVLVCLLTFIVCNVGAQNVIKKSRRSTNVSLSIDNGMIINRANILNNGSFPDPITVPNKLGYRPGILLEIQRTTRKGLLFGGGLYFGNYKQDFDVVYDSYRSLDTSEAYENASAKFIYRNQSLYWAARAYLGYSWQVKKSRLGAFVLEAKIGLMLRRYFDGNSFQQTWTVSDFKNDTIHVNKYLLSDVSAKWGKSSITPPVFLDMNISIKKQLKWKPISSVAVGVFANMRVSITPGASASDNADVRVRSPLYKNGNYDHADVDYYSNRDLVIGIRASFDVKL